MIDFDFGDVVLVPFPFTDQSSIKKRPAVVVSSITYNRDRPDIIILAVTSQITAPSQIGTFLVKDWKAAGLLKPSVVKPIITTLQKTLVKKKLGRLIGQDIERLQDALQSIFGDRS
jgi:mRNA interferase MazF